MASCQRGTMPYKTTFMARLILVHHPKDEPRYQKSQKGKTFSPVQIIPWNCGSHKRKLIRHDGIYLESPEGTINYAPLYFWGEYEPYSCAHVYDDAPAIHDDLKSARNVCVTPIANMQNSDPYVFGSRFKYICCMKRGDYKKGDIVLFGHYDSASGRFYFDTVFVVKEDKIPSKEDIENQYYMASARIAEKKYAEGIMYKDNERYFSFVPCRVGDWSTDECEESKRFLYEELPYLEVGGLLSYSKDYNKRNKNNIDFDHSLWQKIINAVKDANMCFGIHLAEI